MFGLGLGGEGGKDVLVVLDIGSPVGSSTVLFEPEAEATETRVAVGRWRAGLGDEHRGEGVGALLLGLIQGEELLALAAVGEGIEVDDAECGVRD